MVCAEHNHDPVIDPVIGKSAFPEGWCLTPVQHAEVKELILSDIQPTDVIAIMTKRHLDIAITPSDINNLKSRFKLEVLDGQTSVEATLKLLNENEVFHLYRENTANRIMDLFIQPTQSKKIRAQFSNNVVFLVDFTYKTNTKKCL